MNFSLISNLKEVDPEVVKNNWKDLFFSYSIEQQENLSNVLQATNITKEIDMVKMEMAAIDLLQNNKSGYTGIIDILSKGNLETFHKRLGISDNDLFNRSETGKRDVYVSSLTEDVANFIAKLWDPLELCPEPAQGHPELQKGERLRPRNRILDCQHREIYPAQRAGTRNTRRIRGCHEGR